MTSLYQLLRCCSLGCPFQALLNVLLLSHRAVAANPRNADLAEATNAEAESRASAGAAAAPEAVHGGEKKTQGEGVAEAKAAPGTKPQDGAETSGAQQFKPILDPGLRVGLAAAHAWLAVLAIHSLPASDGQADSLSFPLKNARRPLCWRHLGLFGCLSSPSTGCCFVVAMRLVLVPLLLPFPCAGLGRAMRAALLVPHRLPSVGAEKGQTSSKQQHSAAATAAGVPGTTDATAAEATATARRERPLSA